MAGIGRTPGTEVFREIAFSGWLSNSVGRMKRNGAALYVPVTQKANYRTTQVFLMGPQNSCNPDWWISPLKDGSEFFLGKVQA